MNPKNTKTRKRKKYKKFRDMTKPQQIKLVRSLTIVGLVFVAIIGLITGIIFRNIAEDRAESDNEGDIFSRGYVDDDTSVITFEVPQAVRESIDRDAEEKPDMTPVYQGMKRDNPDFAGYLKIEGIGVEYPVMYSPEDPERYLTKDFMMEKSVQGLPFIDARCKVDPASDNLIIYGHNMKDGSIFGKLDSYQNKDFCRAHSLIQYDTLEGPQTYKVVYAFYDRVYYDDETDFRFYNFIDSKNKDEFAATMSTLAAKSIYNMEVPTEYGDKFITLVTCSYQEDEGRFVVIAKKI